MTERNYTVGRGEVHFAAFKTGTQVPGGFRYLGNTPEFSLTLDSQNLDHFNSDRGIREKDASAVIEVTRAGAITADDIMAENIAMYLFGKSDVVADVGGTVTAEKIDGVTPNRSYQLGFSDANPIGAMKIVFPGAIGTMFKLTDDTAVTPIVYAAGTDYVLDPLTGMLMIVEGGAIVDGTNLRVTYTTLASSHKRIVSGSEPVNGALKFIAKNPIGEQFTWTLPWVAIRPNGDLNLKGDEWQQITFAFDVLRKGALEGVYVNGVPFVPTP